MNYFDLLDHNLRRRIEEILQIDRTRQSYKIVMADLLTMTKSIKLHLEEPKVITSIFELAYVHDFFIYERWRIGIVAHRDYPCFHCNPSCMCNEDRLIEIRDEQQVNVWKSSMMNVLH